MKSILTRAFPWIWFVCLYSLGQKPGFRFESLTVDEGLSQNNIYCILQDQQGFMWFGTKDGLNRYDGSKFLIFKHDPDDPHSLSDNYIWTIKEDVKNPRYLWIGTQNGGLNRYDRNTRRFDHIRNDSDQSLLKNNDIRAIHQEPDGSLWIGTYGAGIQILRWNKDGPQQISTHVHSPDKPQGLSSDNIFAILKGSTGKIWIGTDGGGLNSIDPKTGTIQRFLHQSSDNTSISHNSVKTLLEDKEGFIWAGTDGGGLNRLDPRTGEFRVYWKNPANPLGERYILSLMQEPESPNKLWVGTGGDGLWLFDRRTGQRVEYRESATNPKSLKSNFVRTIARDRTGVLWFGLGAGGAARLNRNTERFTHYSRNLESPLSLTDERIYSIYQDRGGVLWIGSQEGGLDRLDPNATSFRNYHYDPNDPSSLTPGLTPCIYEDKDGVLWVGTYDGLNRFDKTREFVERRYLPDPENAEALSYGIIYALLEDPEGRFWVGSYGGGLHLMDRENHRFTRFSHDPSDPQSISHNDIRALFVDSASRFWVGTEGGGLDIMDRETKRFRHFSYHPKKPGSLSNDNVRCILESRKGQLWIGTDRGLNLLSSLDGDDAWFTSYSEKDGLPNPVVYGVLEDEKGMLWMSTNRGIARFNPETEEFKNYGVKDGLQGWEFNQGAYFRGADGKMFFGGLNGISAFYPSDIVPDPTTPQLAFTDFLLFHQPTLLKDRDPHSPLDSAIEATKSLTLTHRQNIFSIRFAALHFGKPEGNQFRYRMTPFNDQWIATNEGAANYTNLPAGDYNFQFKASNADGIWATESKSLQIKVLPPPWKTWWAYTTYALIIFGVLLAYGLSQARKLANKQSMVERLTQVDKLKDEILANTSHELRTPLNGMIGLAEALLDGAAGPLPEKGVYSLNMIVSSGRRLTSLVNDILDFSKLKSHNLDLQKRPLDLRTLTDVVLTLSQPLVAESKVELNNAIAPWLPAVMADEDRLLQIMHNLVGNAAKFTESGSITVSALEKEDMVEVTVKDTGIGIPYSKQDRIFESFEQVDGATARLHGGTGLGLAVTRKLVELHGGTISVKSRPGKGSSFLFTLPQAPEGTKAGKLAVSVSKTRYWRQSPPIENQPGECLSPNGEFRILIVDDEPINRQVLMDHLSLNNYNLTQVSSGKEALELIDNGESFDLILLDIMMPGMSGYEACTKLREKIPVHELPVIFLTARNQVEDLVTGLVAGANDFLTKPISKRELLARVRTHLQLLDVNRNLEKIVEQRTHNMNILGEIGREITNTLLVDEIYRKVYDHVSQLMDAYHFGIGEYLPDTHEIEFNLIFEDGKDKERIRMSSDNPNSLSAWCIRNRSEILINERSEINNFIPGEIERIGIITETLIFMPLIVKDRIVGTLTVQSPTKNAYSPYTIDVIRTLAAYTAIALDNASAYRVVAEQNEEILRNRDQLIMKEKLASMGRLSAGIAHELRNPLNFINNFSEVTLELLDESKGLVKSLRQTADPESSKEIKSRFDGLVRNITRISEHGVRATRIVNGMIDIANESPGAPQEARVEKLLVQCIQLARHRIDDSVGPGIIFEEDWEEVGIRMLVHGEISRALLNILDNAIEAIQEKQLNESIPGIIVVSAEMNRGKAEILIRDNGIGIPADHLGRIFEPFFTTKQPGDGHVGLGLSLSYDIIVSGHQGELEIHSEEGKYTEVKIRI